MNCVGDGQKPDKWPTATDMTVLDKYVLSQTMRLLMIALGVVLLTLILERVLRLFEFAAENNAAFGLVLQMAANLVPHYLGLALPAAFFISVLLIVSRMGDENELDVIMATGRPIRRTARPLVLLGFFLAIFSIILLGYVQPYSRYGYRAIRHAATHAVWNEGISPQEFYSPAEGITIYTENIDFGGRGLTGVFIHEAGDGGTETTVKARQGQVETDPETGDARVLLSDVLIINKENGRAPLVLHMNSMVYVPDFSFQPPAFRSRGNGERELTLGEIWQKQAETGPDDQSKDDNLSAHLSAEVNGRIVRSVSVATMPFLAVPMGVAAKRRRRGVAIAVGAVFLAAYHYTLELGQGLVGLGVVSALWGMWMPLALFSSLCFFLFFRIDHQMRSNIFETVFDAVSATISTQLKKISFKRQTSK